MASLSKELEAVNRLIEQRDVAIKKYNPPPKDNIDIQKVQQIAVYLKNCIYWMNEWAEGRTSVDRLVEVARSIQMNGRDLESQIVNPGTNTQHPKQ